MRKDVNVLSVRGLYVQYIYLSLRLLELILEGITWHLMITQCASPGAEDDIPNHENFNYRLLK